MNRSAARSQENVGILQWLENDHPAFWCQLTQIVLEKRPLNDCISACMRACVCVCKNVCKMKQYLPVVARVITHTHSRFTALCPDLLRWATTRRNIHPLTLLLLINHPYQLPPSTTNHCIILPQSTYLAISAQPLAMSSLAYLRSGAHYFILHTLLHPIIIILSQHMSIPL